jgi:hypothetical protein
MSGAGLAAITASTPLPRGRVARLTDCYSGCIHIPLRCAKRCATNWIWFPRAASPFKMNTSCR